MYWYMGAAVDFLLTNIMNSACLPSQKLLLQLTQTHQCSCCSREYGVWGWQRTQACLPREYELTVTPPHPQISNTLGTSS